MKSKMSTRCSAPSSATARASQKNRETASSSLARRASSTLIAARRLSRSWRALYTRLLRPPPSQRSRRHPPKEVERRGSTSRFGGLDVGELDSREAMLPEECSRYAELWSDSQLAKWRESRERV